ncbi:MAG: diacylglycerol kinase family lipid kinase [Clostridia bacterium]|nr:diacylglycerol kinase family lipid kinase [Clostridia bacterium]
MKKMAFVYNPRAGKGRIEGCFTDIINAFSKEDYEITLVPTKYKNHCREYIENEGKRFDTICVSGGDGTVNEAFNALMAIGEDKPTLGYIPMGTTNDFASSCNIPFDPYDAARVATGGVEIKIDAGKFNDMYFSYVAAFGILTDVAYDTPQEIKNLFGKAAYVLEGIKRIANVKSYRIKALFNGKEIEEDFIFGMVANSNSVGGVNIKSLQVDLKDGLFEVLLLKKIQKPRDINAVITDLLGRKTDSEYYYMLKTDKITFASDEEIMWTLDGEFGGGHRKAEVENVPGAIKIRVASKD